VPGDSTDDELEPENAAVFEEKFRKLEEERLQIYADVVEEYTDSHLLMNRFNKWRVSFPRWYKVCFIEECTGSVQGCKSPYICTSRSQKSEAIYLHPFFSYYADSKGGNERMDT
jgi:hypothetical protein